MKGDRQRVDDLRELGLEADAGWEEIQSTYRHLALRHHPDMQQSGRHRREDSETFRNINEAYDRLRRRHLEDRQHSKEHIERISTDPAAASLSVQELELRIRHSSSPQVRAASALILGSQPGKDRRSALLAACGDTDPQVRRIAIDGLKRIGTRWDLLRCLAAAARRQLRQERAS